MNAHQILVLVSYALCRGRDLEERSEEQKAIGNVVQHFRDRDLRAAGFKDLDIMDIWDDTAEVSKHFVELALKRTRAYIAQS